MRRIWLVLTCVVLAPVLVHAEPSPCDRPAMSHGATHVYPWPGYQTVLQGLRVSLVNCKRPWPECVRETFDSPAGRAGQIPEMASAVGALQKQQIDVGTDVCPSPVTINSETVAQLKFWCSNRREDCLNGTSSEAVNKGGAVRALGD